jgi:aspartate 1-decarboxylase
MKRFIAAKLHGITVTEIAPEYNGSVVICEALLRVAGIEPYESVDVVNLDNGQRWTTYALPGHSPHGIFSLNGGGARLGLVGDRCVVMTYQLAATFPGAKAVMLDRENNVEKVYSYEPTGD